jgi:HPt (histidine-containing phosphotransfer) domain-containing protein
VALLLADSQQRAPFLHRAQEELPFVVGWDHAAAMRRVDGDADLLVELVNIFLEDYPKQLACLTQALAQSDYATVRHAAHTLKGSLAYLGASEGEHLSQAIEQAAERNDAVVTRRRVPELAAYVEALRAAMSAYAEEQSVRGHRN